MGGFSNTALIQAGVDMNKAASSGQAPFAWYEYIDASGNGPAEIPVSLPIKPGDKVNTAVKMLPATTSTFVLSVDINNASTGADSGTIDVALPNRYKPAGNYSFESIDERPTLLASGSAVLPHLFDFGSIKWNTAGIDSCVSNAPPGVDACSGFKTLDGDPYYRLNMVDNTGALLAGPSSGTIGQSGSFTEQWRSCGEVDPVQ